MSPRRNATTGMTPSSAFTLSAALVIATAAVVQAIPQIDDALFVDDPLTQIDTVYTSKIGLITAQVTSFISSLSSCLIIFIVLRSGTQLSTAYHRIMFSMSVADAMGSLAIFCSTWLMPKEMIYHQFEGAVLGNSATCKAQGFLFFTGVLSTFAFNTNLCVYYLCTIRYNYTEKMFRKCIEPFLFLMAITIPLVVSSAILSWDLFVPTPFDFACTGGKYPYWCEPGDGYCLEQNILTGLKLSLLALYIICTGIIFTTMILVCWTVYIQERQINHYINTMHGRRKMNIEGRNEVSDEDRINLTKLWRQETTIVLFQALGYVGAFLMCQLFPFLSLSKIALQDSVLLQYCHVLFRPLQGFFNFMIFIGHKITNRRRADTDLTKWHAFCQVFNSKEEPTLFVGNISIVQGADGGLDISLSEAKEFPSSGDNHTKSDQEGLSYGPSQFGVNSKQSGVSYDLKEREEPDDTFDENSPDALRAADKVKQPMSLSGISWYSRRSADMDSKAISDAVSSMGN